MSLDHESKFAVAAAGNGQVRKMSRHLFRECSTSGFGTMRHSGAGDARQQAAFCRPYERAVDLTSQMVMTTATPTHQHLVDLSRKIPVPSDSPRSDIVTNAP